MHEVPHAQLLGTSDHTHNGRVTEFTIAFFVVQACSRRPGDWNDPVHGISLDLLLHRRTTLYTFTEGVVLSMLVNSMG
jgi:hypothetical protein